MFESDDFFDQILSQLDFPDVTKENGVKENPSAKDNLSPVKTMPAEHLQSDIRYEKKEFIVPIPPNITNNHTVQGVSNPKHMKRKIINSHFNHKNKRKFPGPAGILTGALQESKDESISHIELLSQDIDYTQNHLRGDLFESPLWNRLLDDLKELNLYNIDSINTIKQQALTGNLRPRKAQTVTAFVETIDRSGTDPLIILRDITGSIKCTLHRDAWSTFSPYIVSEYCALVLWKPTVLTTGSAFKKHYLNITLSNILAIYSSAVLKNEENRTFPKSYNVVYEQDFTVIKADSPLETNPSLTKLHTAADDLFDGLDSIFSDEVF